MIIRSTDIRTALAARSRGQRMKRNQRGFIIDPYRFAAAGGSALPAFADVKLLLHMNGADGSTTFTDSSSAGRTVTPANIAQIDTDQSKFGGSSGLFNSSGDELVVSSVAALSPGTGDFFVGMWARPSTRSATSPTLWSIQGALSYYGQYDRLDSNRFYLHDENGVIITSSATHAQSTWHWVVWRRISGVCYLDVNGVNEGSVSSSQNVGASAAFYVGGVSPVASTLYYNGHIDDLVYATGGSSNYTAVSTPPTAQLPDS